MVSVYLSCWEYVFLLLEPFNLRSPAFVIVDWLIRLHKSYIFGGAACQKKVFAI